MKKRSLLLPALIAGVLILFTAAGIYANCKVEDVITLNEPSYEHKKGIIQFSHKKHFDEYAKKAPDFYQNGCGECHHDDKGKPLANLKDGDCVKRCIECHSKPGEIKGKKAKGLSKEQKREYHANALHDNCKTCHKQYKKKYKTKAAPTTCTKCHPKKKK